MPRSVARRATRIADCHRWLWWWQRDQFQQRSGNRFTGASVPVSGQVTLQAKVTGVSGTQALNWTITELQTNGASGAQCNWLGTTPPAGPCPDGTIQGADASPYTPVTYHAPSASGTFHVVAQWSTLFDPIIIKNGTAVITVQ